MFKKRKKGFTLIELLVVIVVLAILAIITVPNALRMIETAEVRANTQSLSGLVKAAEVYLNDVLIDTISTRNTTTGWVNYVLADNLPNQTHRLRLRGLDTDDASYLRIRNIYITK